MLALKKAFRTSLSLWSGGKPLPEPEPFCATPRPMTGFFATLTQEQKKLALEYRGDETHGDNALAR
jgi:hypothetical protein